MRAPGQRFIIKAGESLARNSHQLLITRTIGSSTLFTRNLAGGVEYRGGFVVRENVKCHADISPAHASAISN